MTITKEKFGPWAVILGGSEGIGEHMALMLGKVGINSVLIARKPEALASASEYVRRETGAEVRTLSLDLTSPDMMERVREVTDDIEVGLLVHNVSGGTYFGSFVESPLEVAMNMVMANPIAAVKLCHHFGKPMADRGHGGILFVGSFGGVVGSYFLAAYAAAKAFNQVLSEGLWAELEPRGVNVMSYLIGLTDTPSYRRAGVTDQNDANIGNPITIAEDALLRLSQGEGPICVAPENEEYFKRLYTMSRKESAELKRTFMTKNHPDKK